MDLDLFRCPLCSQLAELVISQAQAVCGNEACRVLTWRPGDTAEQLLAAAQVIDLDALPGHAPRTADPGA